MKLKLLGLAAFLLLALVIFNWRRVVAVAYGNFSSRCEFHEACGDLIAIDCDRAADGPYYYVKVWSGERVATCGGACMNGKCTNCPPSSWSCH